jgi:hypothetical protein
VFAVSNAVDYTLVDVIKGTAGAELMEPQPGQETGFDPVRRTKRSRGLPTPVADILPEKCTQDGRGAGGCGRVRRSALNDGMMYACKVLTKSALR